MIKRSRSTVASLPAATLLVTAVPLVAAHADILAHIQLDAERPVVRADGRSSTIISARVYDDRGNLVPDGTRVRFTTSAGRLNASVVETQNGVARVTLFAADQPGEALVQAFLDTAGQATPARLTITFSADAEAAETGTAWVQISGADYTGYAANSGVIQANGKEGKATFSYRRLTVSADTIQFNVKTNEVLARGNVTLETGGGGEGRKYNAARLSLMQNRGVAERLNDDTIPIPYELKGPTFDETQFAVGRFPPPSETWALADLSEANLVVVSRSIRIEPNRLLQFRRATFYVNGTKTLSMPYHVMSLDQNSIFPEQVVGVSAQGVSVDFPFYYDVRPSAVGTLYVRRSARIGESAYSVRPGFYLDMVQTYNGARNSSGTVEVNGITRSDWGVRLRHAQQIGPNTTGSAFVDLPDHRSLFLTTQATRAFKTFSLNGVLSATRSPSTTLVYASNPTNPANPTSPTIPTIPGTVSDPTVPQQTTLVQQNGTSGDLRAQIYGETYGRTFLNVKPVLYSVNASISRQSLFGTSGFANGVLHSESVGTRLYTVPLPVARETTFTQSLTLGNAWSQASGQVNTSARGITLLGTSALNRTIGSLGSVGLTYDYTQLPLGYGTGVAAATGKHRIGVTGFLGQGENWGLQLTGSRGLDVSQTTLYSNLLFRISGPWRGRATLTYSEFSGVRYQDVEYALIRRISGRDFAIYYSTTSRRFQLDLSGARF